jgi:peptide/nickel transport system substrate-binding protein
MILTQKGETMVARLAIRSSLVAVVALVLALGGTAGYAAPAAFNPQFADTMRVALSSIGAIDNVDPQTARGVTNWRLVMEAYETLTMFSEGSTEPQPFLAESYRRLEGGRVWEFKLRRGIKFTTGNEVTAEAVKYSIDRNMAIGLGAIFPLEGLYDRTEVGDRYTVRFHLHSSSLAWPSIVANPVIVGLIDPQFVAQNGGIQQGRRNDYVSTHTAGTGPWILEDLRPQQRVAFKRNPDYWRGWKSPRLERVIIQIVPEESTRLLLLEKGDVDIAEVGADALPGLKQRIAAQSLPIRITERDASGRPLGSLGLFWIDLNHRVAPTNDLKVRQALAHSFNYEQFLQRVMNGYGRRMRGIVPTASNCHWPEAPVYTFDLEKAKTLFAEASPDAQRLIRDGGLVFRYQKDYVVQPEGALMWQADLAKIGIAMKLEEIDAATWTRLTRTPPGVAMLESRWTGSYPDAEYFMHPYRTGYWPPVGFGKAYAGGPETDALIQAARTAGTMEARCSMYRRIMTFFHNDAAQIQVAELDGAIHPLNAQARWVRGFVHNPATTSPSVYYPMYKDGR